MSELTFMEQARRRQDEAYALWLAGATFEIIARRLDYAAASGAHHAVTAAQRRRIDVPSEERKVLEDDRLDKAQLAIWAEVIAGDLGAIDRFLRIAERRTKLLGLDAPKKIDYTQHIRDRAVEEGLDPDEAVRDAIAIIQEHR